MDPNRNCVSLFAFFAGGVVLLAIGGCAKSANQAIPPVDVEVARVEQQDVPVVREWVGTLDGYVNAQIRAEVGGLLTRQVYQEGSVVRKGDLLFEIDARPFAAALAQAEGQLAQARAQHEKAELDVARDTPLAKTKAVSEEELDDAIQARLAAQAQIESAQAAVDEARLNLGFTQVVSPIDGIAGLARAQIGDLVGPATGVLTTVSTVDPIKALFPISEQSYLEFRNRAPGAPGLPANIAFELVLSDGTVYPKRGTLFAIDNQVEGNTGTLRIVAVFPNPEGLLRPGQYARVRGTVSVEKSALLVPLRSLIELQGSYQAITVDAENRAHIVTVVAGEQVGTRRVVESGLRASDRIVVEGLQKLREGTVVNPRPFSMAEVVR
jgi:membrane fusion protein (multidrug efflux system)